MKCHFVDLHAQYLSIKDDVDAAIAGVIANSTYIRGSCVEAFEAAYAAYLEIPHCVGCGNGTDALELALKALGIGAGDEVLVPANSWISTAECATNVGAVPVFVDVDPQTRNIDLELLERSLTCRTKAIIPVHLFGLPVDMPAIMDFARAHGLKVVEDCAQAHGAKVEGRAIGTWGDVGCFSFFPAKNLGAMGDAGGVVSADPTVIERVRMLANHGRVDKFDHSIEGRNSRLDGLQAAVLSAKLPHLDRWIAARRRLANRYDDVLSELPLVRPMLEHKGARSAFHLYVIEVENRDAVRAKLADSGIPTGIHYPIALPFLAAYRNRKLQPADYPVAHRLMDSILSLPIYPEMDESVVDEVAAALKKNF